MSVGAAQSLSQRLNELTRRFPEALVWLLGLIPLALLVWQALQGGLGVDPVREIEHHLGKTGLWFLIACLAIPPLRALTGVSLLRQRRALAVFSAQQPRGQREIGQKAHADVAQRRKQRLFGAAVQKVVFGLGREETAGPIHLGRPMGIDQLPSLEVGTADIADFPLAQQIFQCPQGFLDRGQGIGEVILVKVDVIGLEPPQAILFTVAFTATALFLGMMIP